MSRPLELPDDLYLDLERVASSQCLTPLDWIAATVPHSDELGLGRLLAESLDGLIGKIDSAKEAASPRPESAMGSLIEEKLERQGVAIGEDRLIRRATPRNEGVIDWLLARPEKDFFVPIDSESTDLL
jgi:hypothetical protein